MYKTLFFSAVLTTLTLPLFLQSANAATSVNVPAALGKPSSNDTVLNVELLKEKFSKNLGMKVDKIEATPIPGIALVVTEQGIFYASYNGDFLIHGKVYSLGDTVINLTENSLAEVRLKGIETFKDDTIVYKAKNEKYVVNVFTDITCGYCRKMHEQMDDYNARGITFRYLAYPRSGIKDQIGNYSKGFKDLRSVWCNEDSALALTKAKSGSGIANRVCESPIEAQFNFGRKVGVSGTPAIILSNGTMIPGYQPPEQLEALLKTI
jgi:thiol:disulfide interchange protein DsbC